MQLPIAPNDTKEEGRIAMSKSDLSAITEIVPQISYDIIGRIIPGTTVIASLIIAITGPTQALTFLDKSIIHPDPALSGWAVALFVIEVYVLAVVMNGIWQIPGHFRRLRQEPYTLNLKDPSEEFKYDAVNQKSPKAGAWFTKINAERNQAEVLIAGWLITAAINLYFLIAAFSLERIWFEVILLALIAGACKFHNSIRTTYEIRLDNLWLLLECDKLSIFSEGATTVKENPHQDHH